MDLNGIETGAPLIVEYPEIRLKVSEGSILATCPYCQEKMKTNTKNRNGPFTLVGAVVLAHCLLCWVPFVVDRFKDIEHSCSKCKSVIGIFKRM